MTSISGCGLLGLPGRLPDKVVWRKHKMGFTIPKEKWLTHHRSEIVDILRRNATSLGYFVAVDYLVEHLDQIPPNMLWRCVNVAKWLEIFAPRI